MKKILTLFMAIMLISSIVSINAMAMEQTMTLTITDTEIEVGATSAVVTVEVTAESYPLNLAFLEFDVVADDGISLSDETASVAVLGQTSLKYDSTTSSGNYINITDDNGEDVEAESATSFKLVFDVADAVAGNEYAISLDAVAAQDYEDWDDVNITVVPGKITVKDAAPSVATVVPTAATLTKVVETTEDKGWQKGQAVAMTFNVADLAAFADMSWELTLATAGAKYAPVDFDAETIAAIGEPTVQFVASFVVNSEADKAGDTINSIVAGFCDANKNLVAKTAAVAITAEPVAE